MKHFLASLFVGATSGAAVVLALVSSIDCGLSPAAAANLVVDVADAVCTQIEKVDNSQYIDFACTVVGDVPPGALKTYIAHVPVSKVDAFRALHLAQDAGGAP